MQRKSIANALPPARPNALEHLARPVIDHGVLNREHEQVAAPQLDTESQGPQLRDRLLRLAATLRAELVLPLLPVHRPRLPASSASDSRTVATKRGRRPVPATAPGAKSLPRATRVSGSSRCKRPTPPGVDDKSPPRSGVSSGSGNGHSRPPRGSEGGLSRPYESEFPANRIRSGTSLVADCCGARERRSGGASNGGHSPSRPAAPCAFSSAGAVVSRRPASGSNGSRRGRFGSPSPARSRPRQRGIQSQSSRLPTSSDPAFRALQIPRSKPVSTRFEDGRILSAPRDHCTGQPVGWKSESPSERDASVGRRLRQPRRGARSGRPAG
jgi:hypothetical protein